MTEATDRFALPLIQPGQAQKEIFHNEALAALDLLLCAAVETMTANDPPVSAAPGQSWIVGASPSGDWAGHADAIAAMTAGGWRFAAPVNGLCVWIADAAIWSRWDGSHWSDGEITASWIAIGGLQVIGARQPAVADPAGGTSIDTAARAALSGVLAALRDHGLIAR